MSGNGLNSGYIGTDQRRTKAGSYDSRKHYLERTENQFLFTAGWTPASLTTNLLLWYAADKETLYAEGNAVSTLTNFGSGSNANAFGTGPTYRTNILNSLPIYRFNNNPVRTTTAYSLTNWTFIIVFNNTSGTEAFERLVDHDYVNGFWFGRNESTANSFGGGVKESSPPYGRYVTAADGQWNIIGNQRNGTTHNIWNNGNWTTRATGTVTDTATTSNVVGIGGWYNNSSQQAVNIDIAELVFYNTNISDTNRENLEGYLAWKYGLTGNLPSNHPYKNTPP